MQSDKHRKKQAKVNTEIEETQRRARKKGRIKGGV
jgi:hypothetical protein